MLSFGDNTVVFVVICENVKTAHVLNNRIGSCNFFLPLNYPLPSLFFFSEVCTNCTAPPPPSLFLHFLQIPYSFTSILSSILPSFIFFLPNQRFPAKHSFSNEILHYLAFPLITNASCGLGRTGCSVVHTYRRNNSLRCFRVACHTFYLARILRGR